MYSLFVLLLQVVVRIRPLRPNETQRLLHTIGDKVPFLQLKVLNPLHEFNIFLHFIVLTSVTRSRVPCENLITWHLITWHRIRSCGGSCEHVTKTLGAMKKGVMKKSERLSASQKMTLLFLLILEHSNIYLCLLQDRGQR